MEDNMKRLVKTLALAAAAMLIALPVMAGEQPEYDAVGCDATTFFAQDIVHQLVVCNNIKLGKKIECYSDWAKQGSFDSATGCQTFPEKDTHISPEGATIVDKTYDEWFSTDAGQADCDVCFPGLCSYKTTAANSGQYIWQIELQKKPATDLDLIIHDCVVKPNSQTPFGSNPFEGAAQTGRTFTVGGASFFTDGFNPAVTVLALPGKYKTSGFPAAGFILDARRVPGLGNVVPLQTALFTSKGIWSEDIVIKMPENGGTNALGTPTVRLKQGDKLKITVDVPFTNPVDISYAPQSVLVEFVAEYGTELIGPACVITH